MFYLLYKHHRNTKPFHFKSFLVWKARLYFIQWCCERGAKSHRKRTKKKPWRKRQSRCWRFSFHKYFTTFFQLFYFITFFYTFFLPTTFTHTHTHAHTHDPRLLAKLKAKFSVVLQPRASFAFLSNVWAKYRLMSSQKKSEQFDRKCMSSTTPV